MSPHHIIAVECDSEFRLYLQFEDGSWRMADLENHLNGEVFEPLRDLCLFRTAKLNLDVDTVVWENGADMSPDFLYEIGVPIKGRPQLKAAEESGEYKTRNE